AYVASHDLQEPLRMVASYTQLLQRRYADRLDATANEFIEFAVDGARRMQNFITDLLEYSRVSTNAQPPERVELSEVFQSAVENLTMAIADAGANVTSDTLPAVQGDSRQFVQLFQNLIGNAIKFRGDVPPTVHVSAARESDRFWRIGI